MHTSDERPNISSSNSVLGGQMKGSATLPDPRPIFMVGLGGNHGLVPNLWIIWQKHMVT